MASKEFIKIDRYFSIRAEESSCRYGSEQSRVAGLEDFVSNESYVTASLNDINELSQPSEFSVLQTIEFQQVIEYGLYTRTLSDSLRSIEGSIDQFVKELDYATSAVLYEVIDAEMKTTASQQLLKALRKASQTLETNLPSISLPPSRFPFIEKNLSDLAIVDQISLTDDEEMEISLSPLRIRSKLKGYKAKINFPCKMNDE